MYLVINEGYFLSILCKNILLVLLKSAHLGNHILCAMTKTLHVIHVLYIWGQARSQTVTSSLSTLNKLSVFRFIEVAASHYAHISCAMTETGKVYMWGQARGQSITSPLLTQFTSTDDVFAAFSAPPITWRTNTVSELFTIKFLNFRTPDNIAVIYLKFKQKTPNLREFHQKGANGIANSADPDQTAPRGAV